MDFYIWPRMDRSAAEKAFLTISQNSGPEVELGTTFFDYSGVGQRMNSLGLQKLRDELVAIASPFGFKARHGYCQDVDPGQDARAEMDRQFTIAFSELAPMRWAEAGADEVWSWFALALLPDLTHWRWKYGSSSQRESWYKPRWIGNDLTRHTWARYWWRSVQFSNSPELIEKLSETDFIQLLERAETLGANPKLLSAFGQQLLTLYGETEGQRRPILYDTAKRMLRKLTYIDDAALDSYEMNQLVEVFFQQTKQAMQSS